MATIWLLFNPGFGSEALRGPNNPDGKWVNVEDEVMNDEVVNYLKTIVSPAAELHDASLLVERKVLDVHLAGRVVDGRRLPLHFARGHQGGLCGQRDLEVAVGAERRRD